MPKRPIVVREFIFEDLPKEAVINKVFPAGSALDSATGSYYIDFDESLDDREFEKDQTTDNDCSEPLCDTSRACDGNADGLPDAINAFCNQHADGTLETYHETHEEANDNHSNNQTDVILEDHRGVDIDSDSLEQGQLSKKKNLLTMRAAV